MYHEDIWGRDGVAPPFSTQHLDGGEWSTSHLDRCIPREIAPKYPLDRRLGGPQSWSGRYGEEKILTPAGNLTLTNQLLYPQTELIKLLTNPSL
jgi:hypothetical protein